MTGFTLNDLKIEFLVLENSETHPRTYLWRRVHWCKLLIRDLEKITGYIHTPVQSINESSTNMSTLQIYRKLRLIPEMREAVTSMSSNRMRDTGQLDILRRGDKL